MEWGGCFPGVHVERHRGELHTELRRHGAHPGQFRPHRAERGHGGLDRPERRRHIGARGDRRHPAAVSDRAGCERQSSLGGRSDLCGQPGQRDGDAGDPRDLPSFPTRRSTDPAGNYTLSFGGGGLTPATSGAIALGAGTAASMAPNGGGTSAPAGTAVNPPPSVIVRDASGNPVSGVAVTFAASPGSGTVTPTTPVTTGTDGIAAATSWTLSATAGPDTATATAAGRAGNPAALTPTRPPRGAPPLP